MKEERDLMRLSLPYVAAVVVGMLLPASYAIAEVSGMLLFVLLAVLYFHRLRGASLYTVLICLCGFFCTLTARLSNLSGENAAFGFQFLADIKKSLLSSVDSLPLRGENTAALVKTLALGDRSSLPAGVTAVFRHSGASHILALSGLHLGIFYMCLSGVLYPLDRRPVMTRIKSVLIMSLSGLYVLVAGASASLVRAWIFIMIRESASLMHRKVSLLRILLAAILIQLLLNPLEISSVGFQLSYLAVTGIALIYPRISALYPPDRFNPINKIWQVSCLSLSCQIFTAPVAWLHFGTFPGYFLIANLLALPVASLLTSMSIVLVFLSPTGVCPGILLRIADLLSGLLVNILEIVSLM